MPVLTPSRALMLSVLVLLAGCGGGFTADQPTEGEQRFRLVIQNEADTEQLVGLTLTDADGETVLNESKTLAPGGGWVVETFDVRSLETPVTIVARLPAQNDTTELSPIRSTQRGAAVHTITEDGFNHFECNSNVTCWQGET